MKKILLGLLFIPALVHAQVCHVICDDLSGYECNDRTKNFALSDGTLLTAVSGINASFDASGVSGSATVGGVIVPFVIGTSETRVRFTYPGGECVQVSGVQYPSGFPTTLIAGGRQLHLLKSGPVYCRDDKKSLMCFSVKGIVGPPFPGGLPCTPDRVEFTCGVVS